MTHRLAHPHRARGVSLIEALVALLVMSFGILGIVGLQVSLRANADGAKQRAEAVRIAQESHERARAYATLDPTVDVVDYEDIVDIADAAIDGYTTNTSYTLSRTVVEQRADSPSRPRMRRLETTVSWADRAGLTQSVTLDTHIAGVPPEMPGLLGLPGVGGPLQQPGGRHPTIPIGAVDQGNGTSIFTPPGAADGVSWTFNNVTGVITQVCNPTCVTGSYFLLAGFIEFAFSGTTPPLPPTPAQAELGGTPSPVPLSPANVGVAVAVSQPTQTGPACYKQTFTVYVAYYCVVQTTNVATTTGPARWTGISTVNGLVDAGANSLISMSQDDAAVSHYKVCRYTPGRTEDRNGDGRYDGKFPLNGNVDHPYRYENVTGSLVNQNFLVIQAGDGTMPFDCPGDDTSTPLINGNTWRHQPAPADGPA